MGRRISDGRGVRGPSVLVLLCVLGLLASTAAAQQAAKSSQAKPAPREERSLVAYKLDRALTADRIGVLTDGLQSVFPEARVEYDAKTNTILVFGTAEVHSLARELLAGPHAAPKKPASEEGQTLRVFRLKFADPGSVLRTLSAILPREAVKLTADDRTNTIIASMPPELHDRVEELIKILDVEQQGDQIKIFDLLNLPAPSAMQMLQQLPVGQQVAIAVTPESNALVASGPPKALEVIEAILLRLDERSRADKKAAKKPSPEEFIDALRGSPRSPAAFRVRVVWLVTGVPEDIGTEPSADLKAAVKRLPETEADGHRQVAQLIVSTAAEGRFQVSCTPVVGQASCRWEIHGQIHAEKSAARLGLKLSAMKTVLADQPPGASRMDPILQLETETAVPYAEPAVLCVAPIDGQATSILLVQVRPGGE